MQTNYGPLHTQTHSGSVCLFDEKKKQPHIRKLAWHSVEDGTKQQVHLIDTSISMHTTQVEKYKNQSHSYENATFCVCKSPFVLTFFLKLFIVFFSLSLPALPRFLFTTDAYTKLNTVFDFLLH